MALTGFSGAETKAGVCSGGGMGVCTDCVFAQEVRKSGTSKKSGKCFMVIFEGSSLTKKGGRHARISAAPTMYLMLRSVLNYSRLKVAMILLSAQAVFAAVEPVLLL